MRSSLSKIIGKTSFEIYGVENLRYDVLDLLLSRLTLVCLNRDILSLMLRQNEDFYLVIFSKPERIQFRYLTQMKLLNHQTLISRNLVAIWGAVELHYRHTDD